MRLDRLRSSPWLFLAGEAPLPLGERCSPAFIAAAACSDDKEGDLGEGGLFRKVSGIDIRLGRVGAADGDVGSEFRSGIIDAKETMKAQRRWRMYDLLLHVYTKKDGEVESYANQASRLFVR